MDNPLNKSAGGRVVHRRTDDVEGHTEHGQEAEVHAHSLQKVRAALVSQAEGPVRTLRLRKHLPSQEVPMEQAQQVHVAEEVMPLRKLLSP